MEIIINEATYSLPCRSFVIDYSVSEKRKLAVVKEFIIRLLYSINQISPSEVANYFGFSTVEMQIMLSSLQEENLICWEDGNVKLTRYAIDRFEEVDGKTVPRFFELVDQIDTVSFDLLTFRLLAVKSYGFINSSNLEIPLAKEGMMYLKEKAKAAFDKNFNTFLEKIKNVNSYQNAVDLYKINQVFDRDDYLIPINIQYIINDAEPNNINIKYTDSWMDEWDNDKSLFAAISTQTESNLVEQQNLAENFSEYIRITEDPINLRFFKDGSFDSSAAIDAYTKNRGIYDIDTRMIIGNLYTSHNSDIIHNLLSYKYGDEDSLPTSGAIWSIFTENKTWGRGPELENFINSITARYNEKYRNEKTIIITPVEIPQTAFLLKDRYNTVNFDFQATNKAFGNFQCEILLIPNVLVACLFHFPCKDYSSLTLPFGYISVNEEKIKKIQQKIKNFLHVKSTTNNCFERKNTNMEDYLFYRRLLPILES